MTPEDARLDVEAYQFRSIVPSLRFGTASDRYAGWIGQIYSEEWRKSVKKRKRTMGGKKYDEQTVAVGSVEEYFEHFSTLEIDFTFYRALVDADNLPTNNYFVLQRYADAAPPDAQFILKAPQQISARLLRRSGPDGLRYEDNPTLLDDALFIQSFVRPAEKILGSRLVGIILEQEYQRKGSSVTCEVNIAEFDRFFDALPETPQIHIELRSPHLLTPEYFAWLRHAGVGHVFSHWTWLPSIGEQWARSDEQTSAANKDLVCRLLTPRKMPYAKAYALAHPFEKVVEELSATPQAHAMITETAGMAIESLKKGMAPIIISNNRAWGNAPSLAQKVATRILDELGESGLREPPF